MYRKAVFKAEEKQDKEARHFYILAVDYFKRFSTHLQPTPVPPLSCRWSCVVSLVVCLVVSRVVGVMRVSCHVVSCLLRLRMRLKRLSIRYAGRCGKATARPTSTHFWATATSPLLNSRRCTTLDPELFSVSCVSCMSLVCRVICPLTSARWSGGHVL
jgi:hypothetical protein